MKPVAKSRSLNFYLLTVASKAVGSTKIEIRKLNKSERFEKNFLPNSLES